MHVRLLALTITLLTAVGAASAGPDAAALDAMCRSLEAELEKKWHVPGMGLAVVVNDEIVLARGIGVAELNYRRPVTADTMFAVGSTTKAFTATLIGMYVDEGVMGWEDPVTLHIPEFTLRTRSDEPDAYVTISDLLCHRTGFSRMSILWAGGAVDQRTVLTTATGAEPTAGLREKFQYNNIMYLAAGVAVERVAGEPWDRLMEQRLLRPLGMVNATTSVAEAQKSSELALGYLWDEERQAYEHLPMRRLDTIAPAGAINASVREMAQWVRFQLGRGAIDGRRLVSRASHARTWEPQVEVAPGIDYGLGWMIRDWRGQRLIEHGGNIDGFAAQVALLPDSNAGLVMLCNVTATPLAQVVIERVFETIAGDGSGGDADGAMPDAGDLADYVGRYVADFGPFDDARFAVAESDGTLTVDVPGQTAYELKPPDDEGKWEFAMTSSIAVSFDRNDAGDVVGMKMYQAGLTFELPREGIAAVVEVSAEQAAPYLGTYHFETIGDDATVLVQNGRLAIDVPGQMTFELHPPDESGLRVFRATPDIALRFIEEDGRAVAIELQQANQTFTLPRTGDAEPGLQEPPMSLQTLQTLCDLDTRRAATQASGALLLAGPVRLVNAGIEGRMKWYADGPDRTRQIVELGPYGQVHIAVDGEKATTDVSFDRWRELIGPYFLQARRSSPLAIFGDWRQFYEKTRPLKYGEVAGRRVIVVELSGGAAPSAKYHIDVETGDVLRIDSAELAPSIGEVPVVTLLEDYREILGLRVPRRVITETMANGRSIFDVQTVEHVQVEDELFRLAERSN